MKNLSMLEVFAKVGEYLEKTDNTEVRQMQFEYKQNNKDKYDENGRYKGETEIRNQLNRGKDGK